MKGLTYGIYPNLSFLWSNTSFKVSHPRGPGKVEYWSSAVVPADAPDAIKKILRTNYSAFFGPAGMLEQEDAEVWSQQFLVSVTANEFYARHFFTRWRNELMAVEESV